MASNEYHWIMTIQYQEGLAPGAIGLATNDGTITAREGATRRELFEEVRSYVCERAGVRPEIVWVMFFDLARNDL